MLRAIRAWRQSPATLGLSVVVLTLALTAGTLVFSIVDATALRSLPFTAPDGLIAIAGLPSKGGGILPPTPRDYFAWSERTSTLAAVGASFATAYEVVRVDDGEYNLAIRTVSSNLFDVLGIAPYRGRLFVMADELPQAPPVLVLSHETFAGRFNSDSEIIGRSIRRSGGQSAVVVGVLPPRVQFPIGLGGDTDAYSPVTVTAALRDSNKGFVRTVARLKPGARLADAVADVQRISPALVTSLHDQVVGSARQPLLLALGGVVLLILVACVNLAILLVARSVVRAKEVVTRHALGAVRSKLLTDLLTQGLVLVVPSAVLAWLLSSWSLAFFTSLLPANIGRVADIALNLRVFGALVAACLGSAAVFSSLPVWHTTRLAISPAILIGARPVVGGSVRSLSCLVAFNISLVFALSVAMVTVVTGFARVVTTDIGFDRSNLVSVWFLRMLSDVPPDQRTPVVQEYRRALMESAASVAGVTSVAFSDSGSPLSGNRYGARLNIPGFGSTNGFDAESRSVSRNYFEVLKMRVISGRVFQDVDRYGSPRVMVINEIAAQRFFAGRNPIGAVVDFRGAIVVIGIVAAVKNLGPESIPPAEFFLLADQESFDSRSVVSGAVLVRTTRSPSALASSIGDAVTKASGLPPLGQRPASFEPAVVDDFFRSMTAVRRLQAYTMGVFGTIALVVAAAGIYGTVAFSTVQQTRAIGLRIALGATPGHVIGFVLRRVAAILLGGLAGGIGLSLGLAKLVPTLLPGADSAGLLAYASVSCGLAAIAFMAAAGPARRASRLDPMQALALD